jgi:elongation factor G
MVYNSTKERRERIGRLLRMYADRREDVNEVWRVILALFWG